MREHPAPGRVADAQGRRCSQARRSADGLAEFYAGLHAGGQAVQLDFGSQSGRAELRRLAGLAGIVVESSRPRALQRLGLIAEDWLAAAPGRVWISITGYGREDPQQRVAFGDDAAAAGGLVAWCPGETPAFCGDAIADPLTGILAALAALAAVRAGGGILADVSMAGVSADLARPGTGPAYPHEVRSVERRLGRPPWPAPPGRAGAVTSLLIRNAAVQGRSGMDVRVGPHTILAVGQGLRPEPGEHVIDGEGGALIPGLHDHHVHLRSTVAARGSVDVAAVKSPAEFDRVVAAAAAAAAAGWVRVIGWHEQAAGALGRTRLDALAGPVPVRVQHRGGAMWVLNSAALDRVGAADSDLPGVERDERGEPTGRLLRLDGWLRERLQPDPGRDAFAAGLARYATECVRRGVTGWTDATPDRDPDDADEFSRLSAARVFRQRLVLMAPSDEAPAERHPAGAATAGTHRVTLGPVKVMLDDIALPAPDRLATIVQAVHASGRAVAIHCVTAEQIIVAASAAALAGPPGPACAGPDRIEHAAIVPPGYAHHLARLGLAVVTQPGFIAARGDSYKRDIAPAEQAWLYPVASLIRAGVTVAASTDVPFGPDDPWDCIAAAVTRRAPNGHVLSPGERVAARTALKMFLAAPDDVRRTRTISPGQPADLCLLHCPLTEALATPSAASIRAVITAGRLD